MNEKILRIPYSAVNNDWNFLQKYLKAIGNPKYILVGDVNLRSRQDISDLGNLVGVEGDLDLGWTSIESLGELEFVGENLFLIHCKKIQTLGKLKKVEGYLSLSFSSIESLGELEFVFRNFDLFGCRNLKTLGKLKRVGGNLDLNNTTLESLGELEFVGRDLYVNDNIPLYEINKVEVGGRINR